MVDLARSEQSRFPEEEKIVVKRPTGSCIRFLSRNFALIQVETQLRSRHDIATAAIAKSSTGFISNLQNRVSQESVMAEGTVSVTEIKQYLHSLRNAGLGFLPKSQRGIAEPVSEHHERNVNSLATRKNKLLKLSKCVAECRRCQELAETRTQTVFGVGNPEAKIMFIGEAPGKDEDRLGEPFVGRAGKLLDSIVEACNLKREEIYICNILKCRPPGNRNPEPEEAANCREYLDGQIEIVDPDYIICWGSVAAKNLLDSSETIGRMRKQFFEYGRAKVLCTYHPSYLLRNPSAKKEVWDDMKLLFKEMGVKL